MVGGYLIFNHDINFYSVYEGEPYERQITIKTDNAKDILNSLFNGKALKIDCNFTEYLGENGEGGVAFTAKINGFYPTFYLEREGVYIGIIKNPLTNAALFTIVFTKESISIHYGSLVDL